MTPARYTFALNLHHLAVILTPSDATEVVNLVKPGIYRYSFTRCIVEVGRSLPNRFISLHFNRHYMFGTHDGGQNDSTTTSIIDVVNNLVVRKPPNQPSRISSPICEGMMEISEASEERAQLNALIESNGIDFNLDMLPPRSRHLAHGLALTVGSALGETPPSEQQCLAAFLLPNKSNLTAGARAWSKHAHRSEKVDEGGTSVPSWWGSPKGPVAAINERALALFWRVMHLAMWRNLHWLPHTILVYEVRVKEGYGMRWSQNRAPAEDNDDVNQRPWVFRGFVEPMMEGGHEVGWRH